MADEKKDMEGVGLEIEGPGITPRHIDMPNLPKPLTLDEKKYLLAVERGDVANVRRMLQLAHRKKHININCVDPLGRGSLSLAIDGENLEMVELLVIMGVQTKDGLLHAIDVGFVEATELLLEHEELIHKEGESYSWQKVDWNTATFTPDITPLTLAAHRNNYEILKILLDRGATLPMPHDVKCGCDDCIRESQEDSLKFSVSRLNEYRALASPSLIALSSNDPILTAFQLSWELRNLAFAEQESKSDYMELRRQCQQFAVDLLHQSRSSTELAIILNHDPDSPPYEDGEHMKLARLELAINYKQKKFVAHPNIQQLLATIWYEGLPGFRRKPPMDKLMEISKVALLFPFYCMLYMIAPNTSTGKLIRKPFMKFLIHASSYLFFLLILILVSQRAEVQIIQLFGTESMRRALQEQLRRQRGNGPSPLEWIVLIYVLGFIWEETMEIFVEGIRSYLRNMWNFIDFTRNSLYVCVALLRIAAYIQQMQQISRDPGTAYIPREQWDAFDPQLIAEGLFAGANIFSALKLIHLFSINPHLGPLQISLGRMVIDIVKFFFIYSLVLFAFACGLNQLLWYFAEMEKRKCYSLPGGLPDWDNQGDACMKWRRFGNLFESSQSLFWASFGGVGIDSFELTGIKSYTRFWGLLMFGSYSVINVIVLLNLLIAMMSNSYAMIDEHSDTEWKFARTRLWMSYFEESATLPPPFNIFPTPKHFFKILGLRKKDKLRRMSSKRMERQEKERDYRYTAVMRALIWRYVSAMHRQAEESPVTEDDVNEVKGEISAAKCEILEVLRSNGMDISKADAKEKTILGKKMKIWERRLMKDFHVAPVTAEEDIEALHETPPENEDSLARFRRIAKLAVLNSTSHKWGQVLEGACKASQIGRCNNRESYRNQQNLQKAMVKARKLVNRSPGISRTGSPIPLPETTSTTLMELLKDIEVETEDDNDTEKPKGGNGGTSLFLAVQSTAGKSTTPLSTLKNIKTGQNISDTKQQAPTTSIKSGPKSENEKSQKPPTPKSSSPPQPKHVDESGKAISQTIKPAETTEKSDSVASSISKGLSGSIASSDPNPLVSTKRSDGESPPKVIKRKAPVPADGQADDASKPPAGQKENSSSQQYPVIPPPQQQSKPESGDAKPKPQDNQTVIDITGPSVNEGTKPAAQMPAPSQTPCKQRPTIPSFEVTLSESENSNNVNVSIEPEMVASSSTEQLITRTSSPAPLRPVKRIEDVNTIKRQPKGGWL